VPTKRGGSETLGTRAMRTHSPWAKCMGILNGWTC